MNKRTTGILAITIMFLSLSCSVFNGITYNTCSIGITGSAAVIEIKGIGAKNACNKFLQESSSYYETEEQPTKDVICVVPIKNLIYTVRDEGLLNLVGNSICSELTSQE